MLIGEWLELATAFLVLFCIIWWIVIGLKKLIYMFQGKCPKGRICKNSRCKIGAWCIKYQRHADAYKNAMESIRESRIKDKICNEIRHP